MLLEVKPRNAIQGSIDFTMIQCGGCGIAFYVPSVWHKSKINNHGSFNCPNGCNRVFTGKSEAEKLKEQMEQLKLQKEKQCDDLEKKLLIVLGEKYILKRQLKRVHKGVCPCCNRSFSNLGKHMKTKHPEIIGIINNKPCKEK